MKSFCNATLCIFISAAVFGSCTTTSTKKTAGSNDSTSAQIQSENDEFFNNDPQAEEYFRVILSSDQYTVKQMKETSNFQRVDDPDGDTYIRNELKKLDKINEIREGVLTIWLMPDSGAVMKVRPKRLTYLIEIDQLLTEDVRRWSFSFPKKIVNPTMLDIKYRVILQKKQTDEEIIREMQQKMRESH